MARSLSLDTETRLPGDLPPGPPRWAPGGEWRLKSRRGPAGDLVITLQAGWEEQPGVMKWRALGRVIGEVVRHLDKGVVEVPLEGIRLLLLAQGEVLE